MEMKNNKRFIHWFLDSSKTVDKEVVFTDSLVSITYHYNKYDQTMAFSVALSEKRKNLIYDTSLFLLGSKPGKIQLAYVDELLRIFRSKGTKSNYLITTM